MVRPAPEVDMPTYEIAGDVERYDQRDHPNARILLVPGTPEYEDYYSGHPEFKEWDDENRRILSVAKSNKQEKDPVNQHIAPSTFYGRKILGAPTFVDDAASPQNVSSSSRGVDIDPGEMARKIKGFGRHLGAAKVRITTLRPEWTLTNYAHPYSPESYGSPVELDYKNIICMAFPHNLEMLKRGTGIANSMESGWIYAYSSLVSIVMARFIRSTGWRARALPSENAPYLVVPTFVDAGVGEQGRCSFVVTKEFGNNFKPSAVATDMPLALDKPVDFGVQDFCEKCMVCAEYCPADAIGYGGKETVRGVRRWVFDGDKCRRYWSRIGGSCSICVVVCPWSHHGGVVHDTARELAQRFKVLRKYLIQGEKLFYGKFKPSPEPDWVSVKGTVRSGD
jgi:reductive dehalogenase